ncbi:hypothetical protein [Rhodanobacter geophilus]|uniref:DUF3592 domain-containing protein n=1 Tax=Rhodanobacter geophilus TaxID=3162488 RepID=A0ABV3QL79_9GAMM
MDLIQGVTLGIAVIGATLGVFNAYWMVRKDVVRLRVLSRVMFISTGQVTVCIEVINTGYIPVTITEVGYTSSRFAKQKSVITNDFLRQTQLPCRLEPRAIITVTVEPTSLDDPAMSHLAYCHAKTACGILIRKRLSRSWRGDAAKRLREVERTIQQMSAERR